MICGHGKGGKIVKKEKWMLGEIDSWEKEKIIDAETADVLKAKYTPKKKINLMIVLFSVIGTLFVGLGIVLVGAHNFWYKLPIAARTVIGLLPLVASQIFVLYVFIKRAESLALRESAAMLNVAGVFSSLAIVGQIFHLPSDFTNYILACGILSLPSIILLNAVSPLTIYFWTAINGGLGLVGEWNIPIAIMLCAIGAIYSIFRFSKESARSVYAICITTIAGFVLLWISSLFENFDLLISLPAYFALLISASSIQSRSKKFLEWSGVAGTLICLFTASYKVVWSYIDVTDMALTIVSVVLLIMSVVILSKKRRFHPVTIGGYILIVLSVVCGLAELNSELYQLAFSIVMNIMLVAIGVYYIRNGAKQISLLQTNVGMLTVCTVIIMRFFDSEMSLGIRGVVFILLGAGFLFVNSRLVKVRKKAKEEN